VFANILAKFNIFGQQKGLGRVVSGAVSNIRVTLNCLQWTNPFVANIKAESNIFG
jgi:hypothetical protein